MVIRENAEELASIAEEIGAEVIRGALRYPGREGGFEIGDVDIGELLYELKGQEVVIVIAPLGPVEEPPTICRLCRTPYEGKECPVCKTEKGEAKRVICPIYWVATTSTLL